MARPVTESSTPGRNIRQSVANPPPSRPFPKPKIGFGRVAERQPEILPTKPDTGKWGRIDLSTLTASWFASSDGFRLERDRFVQIVKRVCDVIFAAASLVVCLPLFAVVALCITLESPGPVFYLQNRTGWKMRPFRMIKFRSMRQDAERDGIKWAMEKDPRITRIGRVLRLTRLDEFPQLINVLRGDMSIIGPRPERPEFDLSLAEEIPYYETRYSVLPGLSGWAQVMFTYGASVDDAREKLAYDLYYLKNYSLLLDLQIALKTVIVVVTGKGR